MVRTRHLKQLNKSSRLFSQKAATYLQDVYTRVFVFRLSLQLHIALFLCGRDLFRRRCYSIWNAEAETWI